MTTRTGRRLTVVSSRALTPYSTPVRGPFEGIGKPEALKFGVQGAWSRRLTDEHRLVYLVDGGELTILQARYHY